MFGKGELLEKVKEAVPIFTREELSKTKGREDYIPSVRNREMVPLITPSKLSFGLRSSKQIAKKQKALHE